MIRIHLINPRYIIISAFFLALSMSGALYAKNNSPLCFTARNGNVTVKFDIVTYIVHTMHCSIDGNKVTKDVFVTPNIQYSTDGSIWTHYVSGHEMVISQNQSVYFRAESNQTFAYAFAYLDYISNPDESSVKFSQFCFASSNGGTIEGSGNIMSLYGPDCPNIQLHEYAFYSMFKDCKLLTKAPLLPATKLGEECYCGMFEGCTLLTEAPLLPAKVLADRCYYRMFSDCSSLAVSPALPATNLSEYCYCEMFDDCISLATAPSFPATILKEGCYSEMFSDCISLTDVPSLPAATLADACYEYMFKGCTSLVINTTGPGKKWIIRAKTEDDDAMEDMFKGTGGTMNGTPETKTTYYIFSDTKGKRNH